MRPRSRIPSVFVGLALIFGASVASGQVAPVSPGPELPTPPADAPAPPPDGSDPNAPKPSNAPTPPDVPTPTTPTTPTKPGDRTVEFSPMPPIQKNPVDVLPPDVVYPPNVSVKPKPVEWRREWPRFSTTDWVITGAGAVLALAAAIIPPVNKKRLGGWLFDDDVRDAIRLTNPQARFTARDVSDVILSLEATWPFFVDAVVTTWWFRGSPDAAAQMALVDAQALAIITGIQGITNTIASRERPYGQTCGTAEQPEQTNECEGNVRHRSFFSGHAAFAFMSAGLVCVHHIKHGLYRGAGDTVACIVAYTGAAATATLRVMGDMHYATDVLTGAAVGTAVGLAVPLWHYRKANIANDSAPHGARKRGPTEVDMTVVPVGLGLGVAGTL